MWLRVQVDSPSSASIYLSRDMPEVVSVKGGFRVVLPIA
jgi:hypothetical protein